jgi:hypothetical protein
MGKTKKWLGAGVVAIVALLPAGQGQAAAPAEPVRPAAAPDHAAERAATADDPQCTKPVRERVANWFCLTDSEDRARGHETAAERRAEPSAGERTSDKDSHAEESTTAAVAASEEYCLTVGCWYRNSSISASFNFRRGFFGYGSTTLGEVDAYADITMTSGAAHRSKPVYFGSTRTVSLTMEESRLKVTGSYPGGTEIGGSWSHYGPVPVGVGDTVYWDPNGYTYLTKDGTHQSMYHSFTWSTAGYPGVWRMYFKSQKLISTNNTNWYFSSPSNLPYYPGSGAYYAG